VIAEPILLLVLDLVGTFVFALDGALVALRVARLDIVGAITLGMVTAIGGGTMRDVLVRRVPAVLQSGLYAIPAIIGAALTVAAIRAEVYGPVTAVAAAAICFLVRMVGVRYDIDAPRPPRREQ